MKPTTAATTVATSSLEHDCGALAMPLARNTTWQISIFGPVRPAYMWENTWVKSGLFK